jgi:hypothetical protein
VRVACEQQPLTHSKSRVVPGEGIVWQSSVSSPQVYSPGHRGPWTVDGGPWTVDRGLWTVDCGLLAELLSPSTQEAP